MNKNGQTTLEYAVVITCVVAALLAMQIYLKRSMQGRLRQAADELGQQYSPKNTTIDSRIETSSLVITTSTTVSEKDLFDKHCANLNGMPNLQQRCIDEYCDLNKNGKVDENVFGTELLSELDGELIEEKRTEAVGNLEQGLF